MTSRLLLTAALAAMLAAAPVVGSDGPGGRLVVLVGGEIVDAVAARVEGDLVYVTLAGGGMLAYGREDVDLVASGLAGARDGAAPSPRPVAPPSLAAASSDRARGGSSVFTITDADVAHITQLGADGDASEDTNGIVDEISTGSQLAVSGLRRSISGGVLTLSGSVQNRGEQPVSSISLVALAVDEEGEVQGSGSTTVARILPSQASTDFSMRFEVKGEVAEVKVRASAALASFALPQERRQNRQGPEGGGGSDE